MAEVPARRPHKPIPRRNTVLRRQPSANAGAKRSRCEDCMGVSDRKGICTRCLQARESFGPSLQRARKALFWRIRLAPAVVTPGQVNYVLNTHFESLTAADRVLLQRDLDGLLGATESAYEALLHFGLQQLNEVSRLSELPRGLPALRKVIRKQISSRERAELDGKTFTQSVADGADSLVAALQAEVQERTSEPVADTAGVRRHDPIWRTAGAVVVGTLIISAIIKLMGREQRP